MDAGSTVVLARVSAGVPLVTVLLAARGLDVDVIIAGPSTDDASAAALGADTVAVSDAAGGFDVRPLPGAERGAADGEEAGLRLLSSGTTGAPRATRWPWRLLTHGRAWDGGGSERWAIGYAAHSFAGVSATCQALGRAASLEFVRPTDLSAPEPGAPELTVAAGTPSFWRMAAIATREESGFRRIGSLTMGGESVDQSLLDLVRESVAPRRITQIFGTTELGTAILVDDELPGLPEERRGHRLSNGAAFEVDGEKLLVSTAPGEPYAPTGDLVRLADGRVHVTGRVGVYVNVGGMKANPYRVTQVLQQHEEVLAARAYGMRSPVLGQVVAADVVPRGAPEPRQLVAALKRYTGTVLEAHERPQRINVVDDLAVAESGKVQL
ncbi:hypothetical protein [Streptomyces sp. PU-14G]|uniref:AMP-binding enzyme n=1 Tax=Streptomyces sp. PU-14G TaxID=2800808 RepID=UPI0034DF88BB